MLVFAPLVVEVGIHLIHIDMLRFEDRDSARDIRDISGLRAGLACSRPRARLPPLLYHTRRQEVKGVHCSDHEQGQGSRMGVDVKGVGHAAQDENEHAAHEN